LTSSITVSVPATPSLEVFGGIAGPRGAAGANGAAGAAGADGLAWQYPESYNSLRLEGWDGHSDIGASWQAAVDRAISTNTYTVQLPAGRFTCDRRVLLRQLSGPQNGAGVEIRGYGRSATSITFQGDAAHRGISLSGDVAGTGVSLYHAALEDFSILGEGLAPGSIGINLFECIFPRIHNVNAFSFDVGGQIDWDGSSEVCQNVLFDNFNCAQNNVNYRVKRCNGLTALNCISNQASQKGWHVLQVNGFAMIGGMLQDTGLGMHLDASEAGAIQVSMHGKVYSECSGSYCIQVSANGHGDAGELNIIGGITTNGGGSAYIRSDGARIRLLGGDIAANGYQYVVSATNSQLSVDTGGVGSSRFDLDTATLAKSTWFSDGAVAIGAALQASAGQSLVLGGTLVPMRVATGHEPVAPNYGLFWDTTVQRLRYLDSTGVYHTLAQE
jgi:hypothetical protein